MLRIRLRAVALSGLLVVGIVVVGASATRAAAYPPNTGAVAGYGVNGARWDGLAGFQMLTMLSPHSGYFIAHPGQLNPSFSTDFLGFGTAKGAGVDNCPAYYGSQWQVYVDGYVYGTYFCSALEYIAGNAQSQSIIIRLHPGSCPHETDPGWDVLWQGSTLSCITQSFSYTDGLSAGAENGGNYPNQALAITWVQMQYRPSGQSFKYWPGYTKIADYPPYQLVPYLGRNDSFTVKP